MSRTACHALRAAVEMARADAPLTVADLAARHALPEGALAKVLQALVRAGIAHGTRGVRGGYRLAREASALSALQVVEVFDPPFAAGARDGDAPPSPCPDRLRALLAEVDETTRSRLAAVTLAALAD